MTETEIETFVKMFRQEVPALMYRVPGAETTLRQLIRKIYDSGYDAGLQAAEAEA